MSHIKEKLFEFIRLKTPNLLGILDFEKKQTDDENGYSNDHYIVKCLLEVPDTSIPTENLFGRKEKECLVNITEFKKWLDEKESIIWLD